MLTAHTHRLHVVLDFKHQTAECYCKCLVQQKTPLATIGSVLNFTPPHLPYPPFQFFQGSASETNCEVFQVKIKAILRKVFIRDHKVIVIPSPVITDYPLWYNFQEILSLLGLVCVPKSNTTVKLLNDLNLLS